jgi:hypothetical protein
LISGGKKHHGGRLKKTIIKILDKSELGTGPNKVSCAVDSMFSDPNADNADICLIIIPELTGLLKEWLLLRRMQWNSQ